MQFSDIGTDTGVRIIEKSLCVFFGRQNPTKNPQFAGIPSIYLAYLPRFCQRGGFWNQKNRARGTPKLSFLDGW
jgi:hypothetical protein